MKRAALVLLMLCASAAQAQMYKWKDEKGVTHFTATPPPANAKGATVKNYGSGSTGAGDMPAELAELARNQPVVLYTAPGCAGCDQARALLAKRGIPYRERTVVTEDDVTALKQAGSANGQVPLLLVGRARQVGFEQSVWDEALTNAGYPLVKALPQGYANPAATSAAPPPPPTAEERARAKADADAAAAAAEKARRDRDTPNNAPPHFRF